MRGNCSRCLFVEKPRDCLNCAFLPYEIDLASAETNERAKKPPLGIMPRRIHDEMRLRHLREAIARYMQSGWPVPIEWVQEHNDLVQTVPGYPKSKEADHGE